MLRILSLLPAATEMVYLLGLERYLVGVSHDCDYPSQVKKIPKVTSSLISNAMTSLEIDMAVKRLGHRGNGVFHIDQEMLKKLAPNLILTQELCEVCAIGFNQVKKAARILNGEVKIISLEPESVGDILDNILLIGESREIVSKLKQRLTILNSKFLILNSPKPKVLVIEWLDPLMVAGHWVPEMVVKAGGRMLITKPGERSKAVKIDQIKILRPDILIISPCGFDIQRTIKEIELIRRMIRKVGEIKGGVYLIDGNAYMTRPGPRIVDGIEILSEILHPDVFPKKHPKKDWDILNI